MKGCTDEGEGGSPLKLPGGEGKRPGRPLATLDDGGGLREPDAMADTPQKSPETSPEKSETKDTLRFFLKLALFVFILRSFIVTSFVIPSESMLPRLLIGDYLFVTKWNYGYSRWSLPFGLPLLPGHILARAPARGAVAGFRSAGPGDPVGLKRGLGLAAACVSVTLVPAC